MAELGPGERCGSLHSTLGRLISLARPTSDVAHMCSCSDLPDLIYVEEHPTDLFVRMEHVGTGNWVELYHCPSCHQFWRVDAWDKYQVQIAVKVPSQEEWLSFDCKPLILDAIVQVRGGLSSETCVWSGCGAKAVNGVAYCPVHLSEAGARR